jgi:hypothetical protein
MRWLLPLLLVAHLATAAPAALIPYYRMDALAYLASDVVLCEEGEAVKAKKVNRNGAEYECHETQFTVVRALKGSCQPGERLTVELDLTYTRRLASSWEEAPERSPAIPKGRAVLFLTKDRGAWRPVLGGVKMIIRGEAHCYGQFVSNPGPLWLAPMAPENIEVPADQPYDQELLLEDLRVALEKAKSLTKAIPGSALDDVIRKGYRPK